MLGCQPDKHGWKVVLFHRESYSISTIQALLNAKESSSGIGNGLNFSAPRLLVMRTGDGSICISKIFAFDAIGRSSQGIANGFHGIVGELEQNRTNFNQICLTRQKLDGPKAPMRLHYRIDPHSTRI